MASFAPNEEGTNSFEVLDDTLTRRLTQRINLAQRPSTAPKVMTQTNAPKCCKSCKSKCHLPIFLPYGRFQQFWSGFLLVLVIYSIIETPIVIAFELQSPDKEIIHWVALMVDFFLICDIFINFRTAYIDKYDRLRIIHEPKLIAKNYFKTWFAVDLLSSFPFSMIDILMTFGSAGTRVLKLLRIIRIVKLAKVFSVNTLNYSTQQLLKLVKILCLMLLTCHYFACFWYFIGEIGCTRYNSCWLTYIEEQEDLTLNKITNFTKYTYSVYWAAVSLFTTGYGDIHAWNVLEMWISIFCLLIGCIFFAYFLSVFTSWRTDDKLKQYESDKVEKTIIFCAHYNLPLEIRQACVTHVRYGCNYNLPFDQSQILDFLPPYLQKTVQKYLAQRILSELDLFQSLTDNVIGQLVLKLKSRSCNIGHLLFERGDYGRELYIQRTGQSRLMHKGDGTGTPLHRGDICGENIVVSRRRIHSVQCETWCEFYVLDIEDILNVLKENYGLVNARKEWIKIKQIATKQVDCDHSPRHCKMPTIDHSLDPIFVAPGLKPTRKESGTWSLHLSEENDLLREDEEEDKKFKKKKIFSFRKMLDLFKDVDSSDDSTDTDDDDLIDEKVKKEGAFASMQNLFRIRQTSYERNVRSQKKTINRRDTPGLNPLVMSLGGTDTNDYKYQSVRYQRMARSQKKKIKERDSPGFNPLVMGSGGTDINDYEYQSVTYHDDESCSSASAGFGQQHGLYSTCTKMEITKFKKNTGNDNDDRKNGVVDSVLKGLDVKKEMEINTNYLKPPKKKYDLNNFRIDDSNESDDCHVQRIKRSTTA